jgi:hypothetical protein
MRFHPGDAETAAACVKSGRTGMRADRGGDEMALLWFLVLLLIIFALVGGVAVNNWLFLIVVIALVLALVGAF